MSRYHTSAPIDAFAAQLARAPAPNPQPSFGAILRDLLTEPTDTKPESRTAWRERSASDALAKERGLAPQGVLMPLPRLSRALTVAGVSGSQYLVGTDTGPGGLFVDALRDASLLGLLPIQEVGPLIGDAIFPRVSAGSSAVWVQTEGDTLLPQDLEFGALLATPKTVGSLVATTWQFRKQLTPDTEAYILRELAAGIAAGLDGAIIAGSGVNGQPTGVLSTDGIGTETGTSLAWAGILAMLEAVESSQSVRDRTALAWLAAPDVAEVLRGRQRFTGSSTAIVENETIAGRPLIVHNAVPDGTLICGDWSRLWLCHWGALDIAVTGSHGVDFRTGIGRLRAMLSCDVVVSAPSAFVVAQGVT